MYNGRHEKALVEKETAQSGIPRSFCDLHGTLAMATLYQYKTNRPYLEIRRISQEYLGEGKLFSRKEMDG